MSGSSTRKRWLSVRASSHKTNASNRSDLPPDTRNRARVAATWLDAKPALAAPRRATARPAAHQAARSRQLHLQPHQLAAQRPQPVLIVRERRRQQLLARLLSDEHVALLRRPINTGITANHNSLSVRDFTAPRPGGTVVGAHRQALNRGYVLLPLRGTSPPPGRAGLLQALARASSLGPLPTAVEAGTIMA